MTFPWGLKIITSSINYHVFDWVQQTVIQEHLQAKHYAKINDFISVGCGNKYTIIWVTYKQQQFISRSSEGRESEIGVPSLAHSALCEDPPPGLQAANFSVYLHRRGGLASSLASSDKHTHPILGDSTS